MSRRRRHHRDARPEEALQLGAETVRALRGVDLDHPAQRVRGDHGPLGLGQVTLMNLIGCLDTPDRGRVHPERPAVAGLSDDELARIRNREIGFVFQTFNLLPRSTALENVELPLVYAGVGGRSARARRRGAAAVELATAWTTGPTSSPAASGSAWRSRARWSPPSIILADEPTGNLDSRTSEEIMALFERLHGEGQTIIMVTHEHDIAAHAERLVTLRDGLDRSDERQVPTRPRLPAIASPTPEAEMNLLEAVRIALEMIRAHKLRAFFTVLGTVVGVTFLIAVITLIEGMNATWRGVRRARSTASTPWCCGAPPRCR
jgi:putative ABC transport system ATP-binding protein